MIESKVSQEKQQLHDIEAELEYMKSKLEKYKSQCEKYEVNIFFNFLLLSYCVGIFTSPSLSISKPT